VVNAANNDSRPTLAPHETVLSSVHALRDNDTKSLVYSFLTDEQITTAKAEWEMTRKQAIEPGENEAFKGFMSQLTAPGAEKALMEQVEPTLAELRPQLTMMVGMFSGMGQSMVSENDALSPEEKAQASRLLDGIGRTFLTNDLTNVDSARKVIGIVCSAARSLHFDSLASVQALNFDQLLSKGDAILKATKDVLALYGISMDEWLSSFQAETVSQTADAAVVRLHYEFLGVKESTEYNMVKVGKRWVQKETAEAIAF